MALTSNNSSMKLAEMPHSQSSKMSVAASNKQGKNSYNQHRAKQIAQSNTSNAANTRDYQD